MSDETDIYKVVIEGGGLSLSREIDGPTLGRVMHAMLSAEDAPLPSGPEDLGSGLETPKSRPLSLREFLMSTGAKRYPDKIVAIGHYLEEHEGKVGFSKEDIKSRFRAAGEAPPGNFPRDFMIAKANGWIAEDPDNRGQLYVTAKGQEAVEDGFSSATRPVRRRATRRRRPPVLTHQSHLGR